MQLKQCSRLPSQGRVMSSPPPSSPFNGWNVDTRLNQLGPCGLGQHPKGSRTRKQKSLGASQLSRWGITQQIGLSHEKFHMRNLLTQLQVSITYIHPPLYSNQRTKWGNTLPHDIFSVQRKPWGHWDPGSGCTWSERHSWIFQLQYAKAKFYSIFLRWSKLRWY